MNRPTDSLSAFAERDAQIISLQSVLLDYSGHVYPMHSDHRIRCLVREINDLRAMNGWGPLDMRGRR
jgi:hypothetical protein